MNEKRHPRLLLSLAASLLLIVQPLAAQNPFGPAPAQETPPPGNPFGPAPSAPSNTPPSNNPFGGGGNNPFGGGGGSTAPAPPPPSAELPANVSIDPDNPFNTIIDEGDPNDPRVGEILAKRADQMKKLRETFENKNWEGVIREADEYLRLDVMNREKRATATTYKLRAISEIEKLAPPTPTPNRNFVPRNIDDESDGSPSGSGDAASGGSGDSAPAPIPFADSGDGMSPVMMGAIGGGVLLLIIGLFFFRKRGKKSDDSPSNMDDISIGGAVKDETIRPGGIADLSGMAANDPFASALSPSIESDLRPSVSNAPAPNDLAPSTGGAPKEDDGKQAKAAFDALANVSADESIDAEIAAGASPLDPSKLKRAADAPSSSTSAAEADPGASGDVHEMQTRMEADQADMLNPKPAEDSSLNLEGIADLGLGGGGGAAPHQTAPAQSTASGADADDFTFSSLFDDKPSSLGGGAGTGAGEAPAASAANPPSETMPNFGGLFADNTQFGSDDSATGAGQGEAPIGAPAFEEQKPAETTGDSEIDGTLSDIFGDTKSASAVAATPAAEPPQKSQPQSQPQSQPEPPGKPDSAPASSSSSSNKGITSGLDLTIGSGVTSDAPPSKPAAAAPSKPEASPAAASDSGGGFDAFSGFSAGADATTAGGEGKALEDVLFADETVGAFITPETAPSGGSSSLAEQETSMEMPEPAGPKQQATAFGSTTKSYEEGVTSSGNTDNDIASAATIGDGIPSVAQPASEPGFLSESAATPEEATVMSGITDAAASKAADADKQPEKADEKITNSSGLDLSGLDETISSVRSTSKEQAAVSEAAPGSQDETIAVPAPDESDSGRELTPEEQDERRQARARQLLSDNREKAEAAIAAGHWKQAVHHLSIASSLAPNDADLREKLKIAQQNKREDEASASQG